jgi:hypothetical protein
MSLMASYVRIGEPIAGPAGRLCPILIEPSRDVITGLRVIPARAGGSGGRGRAGRRRA